MPDATTHALTAAPAAHANFDLVVIGSGPAGQKAALCGAKHGKRVAIIDRGSMIGGVCIHTGTVPSKAIREAVLHLTGLSQGNFGELAGREAAGCGQIRMADLLARAKHVSASEAAVVRRQMARNKVAFFDGDARFLDAHTISVDNGSELHHVRGEHVLVACGTSPARPENVPFTPGRVIDSDEILNLPELPASMCIVGGGVIGTEYAAMMASCGVRVTLVDGKDRLLDFLDDEIGETLQYRLRRAGVRLRLGESVKEIVARNDRRRRHDDEPGDASGPAVTATLCSGKTVSCDVLLYCIGRQGATDSLDLSAAGLSADKRGRLSVNPQFQTEVPHIYAAGDVVGFPALASTSMEQGRRAALHMFEPSELVRTPPTPEAARAQLPAASAGIGNIFPYGIYTIPEISMVGRTERQLTEAGVCYEVGVARYDEIARGHLMGDLHGMMKLIFCPHSHRLLGCHAIGSGATEIIHIGQIAMTAGLPLEYFVDSVFNYPTLAECFKVAALDGLNRSQRPQQMWRALEEDEGFKQAA